MDVFGSIQKYAPTVAGYLGGKMAEDVTSGLINVAGRVLGVEGHDETLAALASADPAQLAQIENDFVVHIKELEIEKLKAELTAATSQIESVNATMRAESAQASGRMAWMAFTWRPFIGFVTGTLIFCTYFVLPLLNRPAPVIPDSVWLLLGTILGTASYFHGKAQADPLNTAVTRG